MRARPQLQLAWNPLTFVLGQIVVPPVLRIEEYLPNLQERFRKAGFPRLDSRDIQQVKLSQGDRPELSQQKRWVLSSRNRQSSVVVTSQVLVYQTAEYVGFEEFLDPLLKVAEIFADVVDVDFYQRLGFRRVNLLEGSDQLDLDSTVQPGLHGVRGDVLDERCRQRFEQIDETDVGKLILRFLRPAPASGLPPGLEVDAMEVRRPDTNSSESAVLDIDHFLVDDGDIDNDSLSNAFWSLHPPSDMAFRDAISSEALNAWKIDS